MQNQLGAFWSVLEKVKPPEDYFLEPPGNKVEAKNPPEEAMEPPPLSKPSNGEH